MVRLIIPGPGKAGTPGTRAPHWLERPRHGSATAAAAQTLNDKIQVTHIAGAGHNIRREQPQRYLAVVQAFLATLY